MLNKSFRDCYKETLENELTEAFNNDDLNFKVHCTLDINTILKAKDIFDPEEVFVLINLGNASKTTSELAIWQTSIMFTVYCAMNVRRKVYDVLEKYIASKSLTCVGIGNQIGAAYNYYACINYMTPYASNITQTFNGQQVSNIVVSASCTYADKEFFAGDIPTITMDSLTLNNVFSFALSKESVTEAYTQNGSAYQYKVEAYRVDTYTIQFIFDSNNTLHNNLINTANGNRHTLTIGAGTTIGVYAKVDYVVNIGNFTAVTLTIMR